MIHDTVLDLINDILSSIHHNLSDIASVVTILSLILSPIFYFAKTYYDTYKENTRASRNLHTELEDTMMCFGGTGSDGKKHSDFKKITLLNGKEAIFTNRNLNHDFYDSLVLSGKINYLDDKLQQDVENIFLSIKNHNGLIDRIREIEDREISECMIQTKTDRYYTLLHKVEEELVRDIPKIMDKLENEFGTLRQKIAFKLKRKN